MAGMPTRCFTCGKVVSRHEEAYFTRVEAGEEAVKVLDDLGYRKRCCRRMFMTHASLDDIIMRYQTFPDGVQRIGGPRKVEDVDSD